MRKSAISLRVFLIALGASALAMSITATTILGKDHPYESRLAIAAEVNAFLVLLTGIGLMIRDLSRGEMLGRSKEVATKKEAELSIFPTMERSVMSGAMYKTPPRTSESGGRISGWLIALLYIVSAVVPAIGCLSGAIIFAAENEDYHQVGKRCMIISAVVLFSLTFLFFLAVIVGAPD